VTVNAVPNNTFFGSQRTKYFSDPLKYNLQQKHWSYKHSYLCAGMAVKMN